MTPSARAMKDLRDLGYVPWVVETRITSFLKRDLFNCIDILALRGNETLAVQVTSGSNHADRMTKVRASEYLALMLGAGWQVEVWSYRVKGKAAILRREAVA